MVEVDHYAEHLTVSMNLAAPPKPTRNSLDLADRAALLALTCDLLRRSLGTASLVVDLVVIRSERVDRERGDRPGDDDEHGEESPLHLGRSLPHRAMRESCGMLLHPSSSAYFPGIGQPE